MQTLILLKSKPNHILLPTSENKPWSSNAVYCLFYCHLVGSEIFQIAEARNVIKAKQEGEKTNLPYNHTFEDVKYIYFFIRINLKVTR